MITVYLIWTLFGGAIQDVDAYVHPETCRRAWQETSDMLAEARKHRPELSELTISPCMPVEVPLPKGMK